MALDESHDNYYWKPDIVKAISQIENYIDEIVRNADDYVRAVKKKKGVDIRVVRPRGYIIAGTSSQFKNKKESGDFRKLGVSRKNLSFILIDERLENLRNLRSKLLGAPPAIPSNLRGRDVRAQGGRGKHRGICASDISARASMPLDERRRYLAIQKSKAKATPRKLF